MAASASASPYTTEDPRCAGSSRSGPAIPPGPLGVCTRTSSALSMLNRTIRMTASNVYDGRQPPGPPDRVNASTQIEPPAVTCPVYIRQRGLTTRTKNGDVG